MSVKFVCWTRGAVTEILQTEALVGDNSVFLATHFPVEGFRVDGSRGAELEGHCHEDNLFEVLSRPEVRHAFCVVEGDPGSGKSHLIRWLGVKWDELKRAGGNDVVMLIQRADGNLQKTIEQLRFSLGAEGAEELGYGLSGHDGISFMGRAKMFQSALALSMQGNYFTQPLEDSEWAESWQLSQLLEHDEVKDNWKAPSRILEVLSGKEGTRNSELAQFGLEDVRELVGILRRIESPKVSQIRFRRILEREFAEIDNPANHDIPRRELAPETTRFLGALVRRLNPAVQQFLGIPPEGLKELFRRLRRRLKKEGRRLILLLEDLTSSQGIDNLIIDVLVTDSQTRPDECDLISVAGITPVYFETLQTNYVARITHAIHLSKGSSGAHHVTSLSDPSSQVQFATRYLNAVRLGTERLRLSDQQGLQLPNACSLCQYREPCHSSFGADGGIGLYPLTRSFIVRNFDALRDARGQAQKTPRGMIQGLLYPALFPVDALDSGRYPPPEIQTASLTRANDLQDTVEAQLSVSAGGEEGTLARLRLFVSLWGNDPWSQALARDGERTFAGIPASVFESFNLPSVGGETPAAPQSATKVQVREGDRESEDTDHGEESDTPSDTLPPSREKSTTTSGPERTRSKPTIKIGSAEHRERQLRAWRQGGALADEGFWNALVWQSVNTLPWTKLAIAVFIRRKIFTPDTVVLKGTRRASDIHFEIPKEPWVIDGLGSLVRLRSSVGADDLDFHHRRAARFLGKLEALATQHVSHRLGSFRSEHDGEWHPIHSAVQVLVARSWVRGQVSPKAALSDQWRAIQAEEGEALTAPQYRVESWNELVEKTRGSHAKIRQVVRDWLTQPQSQEPGADILDAAVAARSISQVCSEMKFTELPTDSLRIHQQLSELQTIAQYARDAGRILEGLQDRESERLHSRASQVLVWLRGNSITEHARRVDRVVDSTAKYSSQAAPSSVRDWKDRKSQLDKLGFLEPGSLQVRKVQDFLGQVQDDESSIAAYHPTELLAWCVYAPAQELSTIYECFQSAERIISKLKEFVAAKLGSLPENDGTSLDEIHRIGKRLTEAAQLILDHAKVTHG